MVTTKTGWSKTNEYVPRLILNVYASRFERYENEKLGASKKHPSEMNV